MQLPALNIIDAAILIVLGLSMARGFVHGGAREIIGILVWVGAVVVAFLFTPTLRPMMPEIGLFGDFADACLIATFLAFLALFVLSIVTVSILSPLLSRVTTGGGTSAGDQLFGLLFGFLRGGVIILLAYVAYDAMVPNVEKPDLLTSAAFAGVLADGAALLGGADTEGLRSWIGGRLEQLTDGCGYIDRALPDVTAPPDLTAPELPALDAGDLPDGLDP